ncbi:tetraspanin-2A [Ischnura elegans]|uniref:tetraspanin-2A n=1 Tax=Ischnura elegans TaxID=197161 RepID=UPI001ED8B7B7|nr:tetraspanin-2A [Ischnura elegans]
MGLGVAGKGEGPSALRLERHITAIKWTIISLNVISWIIGASVFALCIWLRTEPNFSEWMEKLDVEEFYIGIYVLMLASIIVMGVSFLGCCSAVMERHSLLYASVGILALCFACEMAGSAVLLDNGTYQSKLQPLLRTTLRKLIVNINNPDYAEILRMIQENVGCCGADGPNDYILLEQPLPPECRDTVTGNAFFYGCVEEFTWFVEDKSGWTSGLCMLLALVQTVSIVLSLIMVQTLKKEEKVYKHGQ